MPAALRDQEGVAKYRHEAVLAVLRLSVIDGMPEQLQVLTYRRTREPFSGQWALPSGSVEPTETLAESALRHLRTRSGESWLSHLEQLETLSSPGRDPWDRTIATCFLGLLPWGQWPLLREGLAWQPITELPQMAFDHQEVISAGVERLRGKLSYTNIAFGLAAEEFTLGQLRAAYQATLGYEVSATNLQRVLSRRGQIEPTGNLAAPGAGGGRPARLFRFTGHSLTVTDPHAMLRP
ncbi:NUDIX hydrolase [Corynebacterium alimapuense]|uniref:NUDIX hydrolase n=2 Tax=Corynebacterium alimapuense TaxID=1576874 RepID=A0A3M8K858_9CORY|nr:NUDIX hydrolase [Corynebacterium alimapuense]